MAEIQHLSYSSISSYQLCARAWRFRYQDKIATPSSSSLVFGTAFHRTVEDFILSRSRGESLDLMTHWQTCWNNATEGENIDWKSELPEQICNDGIRMLAHKDTVSTLTTLDPATEDAEPVIEKRIELRVPGVPIPIIGYIDVMTSDRVPCDFKTSARAWTQEKAQEETQPLFYIAALSQAGFDPNYRFRHYVFTKTKVPQVQVIESQHNPASLFWLFESIRECWKGIEANVFPPNPSSWKCSEKWCEYHHLCRGRK